jgi:hypothetical protein
MKTDPEAAPADSPALELVAALATSQPAINAAKHNPIITNGAARTGPTKALLRMKKPRL